MEWSINKTFKWGRNQYHVYLNVDKQFPYFIGNAYFPATWTGSVHSDLNNVSDPNAKGDIELVQEGYTSFKSIKYPSFANGIYEQIIKDIDNELRPYD